MEEVYREWMPGDCKCGVFLGAKRNVGYGWLGVACLMHDAGLGGKAFIAGKGQHGMSRCLVSNVSRT